jgi:hypothetical protein
MIQLRLRTVSATVFLASFSMLAVAQEGDRWWKHVAFLADDALEGRNTGSEGHRKAAEYVAQQFAAVGLRPAGDKSGKTGYIQPVKFDVRRLLEDQSSLELIHDGKAEPLKLGEEANIGVRSAPAPSAEAQLYFVGYGLTVPDLSFDDLKGLPLKGKVVVYISGGPKSIPGPLLAHFSSAGERGRFLKATGVVGTVTIANPRITDVPWERATLARLQPSMSLADHSLDEGGGSQIAVNFNAKHADRLLAGSGHTIAELLAIADRGDALPHFAIPAGIRSRVKMETSEVTSQNVAGVLPGTDPRLKNEFVAITAHLDHLGVGQPVVPGRGDKIYNGAMDNASGVASLIDMAQTFHENKQSFKRSIVFVAVTGEEKGLLGSRYYAAHPTVSGPIVADLNMDMFLPLFPFKIMMVLGLEESDLGDTAREVAKASGIAVQPDLEPLRNRFVRSDQYSFIRQGIPSLAFKDGYESDSPQAEISRKWIAERYHAPSDDLQQPVDKQAAADFNRLLGKIAAAVADRPERPKWKDASFFKRFAK